MKLRTPVIAGLSAAACVAVLARPTLRPRSLPWNVLPPLAVFYVLTVLLASAAALIVIYFILARPAGFYQVALRTATAAVWLAPLSLLLYWRSLWATLAVLALVASLAGLWNTFEGDIRRFVSALGVSTCLQLALVAAMMNYPRVAALVAGVSAAALLWLRPEREPKPFTLPRAMPRLVLAMILTLLALAPYLKLNPGSDGGGLLQALMASEATGYGQVGEKGKQSEALGGGKYPGVILWPEKKPRTVLMPPPPSMGRGFGPGRSKRIVIPFDGVYWFFNVPDRQPPRNSIIAHGSTMKTVYRSVNPVALQMEAHQNLGAFLELNCCRKIEVVIENADPFSEWIALELLLFDTSAPALPPLSLGRMPVSKDLEQMLSFTVPTHSVIRQFDKVTIRFHRGPKQYAHEPAAASALGTKSVKIAIVRFELEP